MATSKATVASDYRQQPDNTQLDHIPGTTGWPLLGEVVPLLRDFNKVVSDHVNQYGRLSRLKLGNQTGVLVTHPDDLQAVFLDKERAMSSEMGYAETLGRFYGGGLALIDFDEHKAHRRIFQNAFKNEAIKGYLDIMNPTLKVGIQDWHQQTDFRFFNAIKDLLLAQASEIFLGLDGNDRCTQQLSQAFLDINEKGLLAIIRKEIPGLAYTRGMKGKRFLYQFLAQLIVSKRQQPGKDLMSILVQEKDDQGELWSDEVLLPHLAFLLFGAHDTTTATLTNLMFYLSQPQHQSLQQRARQEIIDLGKDELSFDDLPKLQFLEHCFLEALRLHPPVPFNMRRTVKAIELAGYPIPENTILFNTPVWAGRSSEHWTDPERFDPDRWAEGREEHKRHSFAFVAFGGGAHKCIGMHFGIMQAKVFLNQFLRRYQVTCQPNYSPRHQVVPIPKPVDNLPLQLTMNKY